MIERCAFRAWRNGWRMRKSIGKNIVGEQNIMTIGEIFINLNIFRIGNFDDENGALLIVVFRPSITS